MICSLNILFNHPVSEATPNSKITGAYPTHGFCKCISHKILKNVIDIIGLPDWLIIPVAHLCPLGKGKLARLYESRTIEARHMNVVVAIDDFSTGQNIETKLVEATCANGS